MNRIGAAVLLDALVSLLDLSAEDLERRAADPADRLRLVQAATLLRREGGSVWSFDLEDFRSQATRARELAQEIRGERQDLVSYQEASVESLDIAASEWRQALNRALTWSRLGPI